MDLHQYIAAIKEKLDNSHIVHFPGLPNFPHHIHVGSEFNVEPGQSRNILDFIDFIELGMDS